MRLAIITAFPASKVTLSEYGYHLVKHFSAHPNIDEIVLITDKSAEAKQLDFQTHTCKITVLPCWSFNSYLSLYNIQKALTQTRPDAVFYNLQFLKFGDKKVPAALGLLSPMISKFRGFPTISLLHNIMEQVDLENAGITENRILQRIYQSIGNGLTRMVLASDVVAVTISKYVKILEEKYKAKNIALVPHGAFETPPEPDYMLPEGPKKVMAFGKFGTYKKVEDLILAVEKIRQYSDEDIEIVIAGTDSPNTPGYLEGVAARFEAVKQLRFTGYVAEEDVPRIFRESAAVVFPYTSTTGSSGVLHQAGSYGRAVVLPQIGDLGILVEEEGYRGAFFSPGDVDTMASAIHGILKSNERRIALGKANYKAACSLPMEVIADKYVQLFQSIIQNKRNAGQIQPIPEMEVLTEK
jgi:glycosyltransferase involved in cell wall biosynthesis